MIQKYFNLHGTREDFLRELRAMESWPEWWPGIQNVKIIKRESTLSVVDLTVKTITTINMMLEFDLSQKHIVKYKQLKGWFKSYSGDYTLLPSPEGAGLTLKISLDMECGMLIPKSMVHSKLSAAMTQFGTALNQRLLSQKGPPADRREAVEERRLPVSQGDEIPSKTRTRRLAHIFQTPKGLEVWLLGKRYLMKSM